MIYRSKGPNPLDPIQIATHILPDVLPFIYIKTL